MFTPDDLAHLKFLEGRWKGTGPDGKPFYEAYDFAGPTTFRSRRYPDAAFTAPNDGSTVVLQDDAVVSRWREFTWRAVALTPDQACFEPIDAPSSFCWRRVGDSTAEVIQRWKDEDGTDRSYTIALERLP